MASKSFLNISKQECLSVYLDILNNSNKNWESGQKLADVNDYGRAISLSIISVEELVKAIIIMLDGKGFHFRRIQGMNIFFKNHQIRFVIAFAMFTMGVIGDDLVNLIKKYQVNPDQTLKTYEDLIVDPILFEKRLKFYAFRLFIKLSKEYQWFSKLEKTRQNGFYSDYLEMLQNPVNLDSQDYDHAIFRLAKVRYVGISIIDLLNTNDPVLIEHFTKIRSIFKNYKIYESIKVSLSKIRESKENIFDQIIKRISKLMEQLNTLPKDSITTLNTTKDV